MREDMPKVLIVDDKTENLIVLESVLEPMEVEIYKATSGPAALALMLEHAFMLVILDVQMPEMDGFEVVELMKKKEKTKRVPIIFVTALSKEQWSVFKGYEVGAVDYLFKPIEPVILKSKVNVFIELYGQRMQLEAQKILLEEKITELKQMTLENGKLHHLSLIDGLTGIANRRSFDLTMADLWRVACRDQTSIGFLMIDIDMFKAYNDKYGHLQGDECLRTVSQIIGLCLKRPLDYLARFGGEEFAVILPNTDKNGAIAIAQEVRKAIRNGNIIHEDVVTTSTITVSIGVTSIIPNQLNRLHDYVNLADEALYLAKQNGRNRVEYLE